MSRGHLEFVNQLPKVLSPLIVFLHLASPALPKMANGRSRRETTAVAEQDQDQDQI